MATILVSKKGFVKVLEVAKPEGSEWNPTNIDVAILKGAYTGIAAAGSKIGVAYTQYVRRLVVEGRLRAIKVEIKGGSKWFIENLSIEEYKEATSRSNRLRNYTLRIRTVDEDAVRGALRLLDIEYNLEVTYRSEGNGA